MTLSDKEAGMLIEAVHTMKIDVAELKSDAVQARSFRSKIMGVCIAVLFVQPVATALIVQKFGH
jgi:hypothetical protein